MTITTVSSRELNQDIGRAKRAAAQGPVIITDRGKPAHVLLSIAEYQRLTGGRRTLAEALAMPGMADIDFDPPKANIHLRIPDFD
ncbi:MAG: type II toxin-antitoxin system Phd/YefM family antitoxin [Gammaproteobacteria bacterium]